MKYSAVLLILCAVGCGGNSLDIELGQVSGTVRLDGKPLPNAEVVFTPEGIGSSSSGLTDENGRYELEYAPGHRGAVLGRHIVQIRGVEKESDDVPPDPGGGHGPPVSEKMPGSDAGIPQRFGTTESDLSATIKSGKNTADFDLPKE